MPDILLSRLLRAVITAWIVITVTFFVLRVTGDPVLSQFSPETTPPEIIEYYRRLWGLDQPLLSQYATYLSGLLQGRLGTSFSDGRPVAGIIAERLPATLLLMGLSFVAMLVIGLPAGIFAAFRQGRWLDRLVMSCAVASYAMPSYVLGVALIWVCAVEFRLLPSSGHGTPAHLVLPLLTLATANAAIIARYARAAALEVMGLPHVLAARAQGWPMRAVIRRDILPNAAIPLVTVMGFIAGGLVGGSIIVEWIFAWPGIGRLLIDAITARDLAVVQALVLLFSGAMIIANFLVDMAYVLLNPQLRLSRR
ncbi:MAG: ABC transporter permease [Rhodobacteraceae bacterium]|nr:ABC transporter permease [Paracoccaceae bacterium]MAY45256.1 ABC transporter permease [Paracoccaceae bacterium]